MDAYTTEKRGEYFSKEVPISSYKDATFEDPDFLSLKQADKLCEMVISNVIANDFNDLAVSVVDAAGNLIVAKKMDGLVAIDVQKYATAKAYTCVAVNNSSRGFRDKYTDANDVKKYC